MEDEEGGPRLSKRFSDKGGEVDFKSKAGTAWSHSYLNQKPWHPLSYPNQRRKWIAEQTFAEKQRRAEEVAREYAQEQEFFRQAALVSKKEKEKMEMMKAVSFMYVRPPGYNAESAKAAEIAEDQRKEEQGENTMCGGASSSKKLDSLPAGAEKKKPRPKDVFGRSLPTEEQFEVLKNAPRLETGVHGRAKPFGVEIRNVKCVRCGNFGHQSGDRECPLKDAIMPNEESRLKRDDPLTAILAQTDSSEPLKWELKQKPGLSPPRGGFQIDDPNQQIVAEDIFDEYGGFLSGDMPELLVNLSSRRPKKKKVSKRRHSSPVTAELSDRKEMGSPSEDDRKKKSSRRSSKHKAQLSPIIGKSRVREEDRWCSGGGRKSKKGHKGEVLKHVSDLSTSESDSDRHHKKRSRNTRIGADSSDRSDSGDKYRSRHTRHHSSGNNFDRHQKRSSRCRKTEAMSSDDQSDSDGQYRSRRSSHRRHKRSRSSSSEHLDSYRHHRHHHLRGRRNRRSSSSD